jgi:hypothetical protein
MAKEKTKLELYSQPLHRIISQKQIAHDTYHMRLQGSNGREVTGDYVRCVCVPSSKGGKMDAGGCFIMETKEDFHAVQDGYLIIYMALKKKSMI